jgi:hypothetical protein
MDEKIAKTAISLNSARPPGWPKPLGKDAMQGLLGEIVSTIGPHTEADPAALVAQELAAFGNAIGRNPHYVVEADRHAANLFVALVGKSARGRKGTSWGYVSRMFRHVDHEWALQHVQPGLSTGEGLIAAIADNPDFERDKRLLIFEDEFSAVLRVMSRWGNTLSTTIRHAWDGRMLQVMTRAAPLSVSNAHISIVAQTTEHDLSRYLPQTDIFNGFANRFLWLSVQRSKLLPDGGGIRKEQLSALEKQLKKSVAFARNQKEIRFSSNAAELWRERYLQLSADVPGLVGAVTSRAESQVRRVALIFALLDRSSEVRSKHLLAAFEVWRYCDESAHFIFGGRSLVTVADKILAVLRGTSKALSRTEISEVLQHHVSSAAISRALHELKDRDLARTKTLHTSGRSANLWQAIPLPEDES